jgi:hypothetical protein
MKALYIISGAILVMTISVIYATGCRSVRMAEQYPTDTIYSNTSATGYPIELIFKRGSAHNHPLMAVWITDTTNKYIETLFIAESIGKGYFSYGDKSTGKWLPGEIRRPAALPVWSYSRNIKDVDGLLIPSKNNPMPDAVTGATPPNNFVLKTKTTSRDYSVFDLYFEINQTWDWNEYWTNNKYPDDAQYKTSCQPALVYKARIDTRKNFVETLDLIGRSSYNGSDGKTYTDLETITTAKHIAESISIKF